MRDSMTNELEPLTEAPAANKLRMKKNSASKNQDVALFY